MHTKLNFNSKTVKYSVLTGSCVWIPLDNTACSTNHCLFFTMAPLEANTQERNPGERQPCCLLHRNLSFVVMESVCCLRALWSSSLHSRNSVGQQGCECAGLGSDRGFLVCQQAVVIGSVQLCHEATAVEESSRV